MGKYATEMEKVSNWICLTHIFFWFGFVLCFTGELLVLWVEQFFVVWDSQSGGFYMPENSESRALCAQPPPPPPGFGDNLHTFPVPPTRFCPLTGHAVEKKGWIHGWNTFWRPYCQVKELRFGMWWRRASHCDELCFWGITPEIVCQLNEKRDRQGQGRGYLILYDN